MNVKSCMTHDSLICLLETVKWDQTNRLTPLVANQHWTRCVSGAVVSLPAGKQIVPEHCSTLEHTQTTCQQQLQPETAFKWYKTSWNGFANVWLFRQLVKRLRGWETFYVWLKWTNRLLLVVRNPICMELVPSLRTVLSVWERDIGCERLSWMPNYWYTLTGNNNNRPSAFHRKMCYKNFNVCVLYL